MTDAENIKILFINSDLMGRVGIFFSFFVIIYNFYLAILSYIGLYIYMCMGDRCWRGA